MDSWTVRGFQTNRASWLVLFFVPELDSGRYRDKMSDSAPKFSDKINSYNFDRSNFHNFNLIRHKMNF